MLDEDEDALICDFQQFYQVSLFPILIDDLERASVLAWGLPDESRIKRLISKQPVDNQTLLMAYMLDDLNFIAWSKTKDAEKGKNKPKSVVESLYKDKTETSAYLTADDWQKARAKILKDIQNGNNSR